MTARVVSGRSALDANEDVGADPLVGARQSAEAGQWLDAYHALAAVDRDSALPAEELELLATAAFLLGFDEECRRARLRAYQIFANSSAARRAALCAVRIGLEEINTGEIATAAGCLPASVSGCSAWVTQAARLLEDQEDCAERGYLLVPLAYEHLVIDGDPSRSAEVSGRAAEAGRRFGDPDLLALALMIQGRAIVRSKPVEEGMAKLDEVVALIRTGAVSPTVTGIVLSSATTAAEEVFDSRRLRDYTESLTAWSERQHQMVVFRSRALACRAALCYLEGRWHEALELAERATEGSLADVDVAAAASAYYWRGEVQRLRGNLQAAGAAFREANQRGIDPQPGLALLRDDEGDTEAALASIVRALGESRDRVTRAKLLAAQIEILLRAGDAQAAAHASSELTEVAASCGTSALEATALQARGAVLCASGDASAALSLLRRASAAWRQLHLPFHEARSRILISRCCRLLDDHDAATFESDAARQILIGLHVRPDAAWPDVGADVPRPPVAHGLTNRESDVLGLLATGLTNRAIAEELVVSVRTVDSHVSAILTKLGVSTRSAATSYAHRHNLA